MSGPEFIVGRAPECKLRPNSDMVSRRHCMITYGEGKATIRDLGSRNGTLLNGERISGECESCTPATRSRLVPWSSRCILSTSIGGKKKSKVHNVQEAAARTVEAARPRDSEPDLSNWLAEEDDGDTKANKMTTTYVPAPVPKPAEEVPDAAAKQQRIDPLTGPGQQKKPVAESSRSAAADMLKQFFKPRR